MAIHGAHGPHARQPRARRLVTPDDVYRRSIRLVTTEAGTVVGDLEDDFHRFRVTLRHDGTRVLAAEGEARRWPWTTCPGAVEPLALLAGAPLTDRCTGIGAFLKPRANCTHLFDLAGLTVSHAARGAATRRYDVSVAPNRGRDGAAVLERDGVVLHEWTVRDNRAVAPAPFSTVPWEGGYFRWAEETFDPEASEAVIVLRRACTIAAGRGVDLDSIPAASDMQQMTGTCYTFSAERMPVALRIRESVRDFGPDPDTILAD